MDALAIDPGKTTGWARAGKAGVLPLGDYADEGEATARFMHWLGDQFLAGAPDALLVERAFFSGRFVNADFTSGLIRIAHAVAYDHGMPRHEMTANAARMIVFGSARKPPDKVRVAKARELGFDLDSDHAADAALLLTAWSRLEGRGGWT